jgi:hypothetical protein
MWAKPFIWFWKLVKTKDKLEYSKSKASESDVVKMMHVYDIKPRMKYAPLKWR